MTTKSTSNTADAPAPFPLIALLVVGGLVALFGCVSTMVLSPEVSALIVAVGGVCILIALGLNHLWQKKYGIKEA